ncbi:242_t:CDS:2, partial [Dentiscutata heterogama]
DQKLVKAWKLNHGLYLAGNNFITSNKIILCYNEKLDIITYSGEPLVYAVVNDSLNKPKSFWSKLRDTYPKLSSTNETANNIISDADISILFPIAAIKYTGSINKIYDLKFENKNTLYGHFFARKLLAGGKLIIRNFTKANSIQIENLKSHLAWALDASNLQKETPFKNVDFDFPIIETTEQKFLKKSEDLIKWMKDLYEDNTVEIISYEEVVPISTFLENKKFIETFTNRLVPEISDMHEELTFNDWISDLPSANLLTWIDKYHFNNGILIDQFGISPAKRVHVEEILSENNIDHDSSLILFIEQIILEKMEPTDTIYLSLQNKKFEIYIEDRCFSTLPNFMKATEDALNDIKPYKALRKLFDEFGHFLPRKIILGNQAKESFYNSTNESINLKKQFTATSQYDIDKVFKEEANCFDAKCLLTSNGQTKKKYEIFNWFSEYGNDDKHFKIIGMNLVPLYKILDDKLQNEVEIVLKNGSSSRIVLTGITANNVIENHTEAHFRINFNSRSLDSNSFYVFGHVFDNNDVKLENCVVRFDLFDFYGFSAFVTFDQSTMWDIERGYIIWMVVGKPAKLGVFSKVHCETKITCYKTTDEDIKYDNSFVFITMPFSLEVNCIVSFVASYTASNNPPKQNFRLLGWSNKVLKLEIIRISDKKNSNEYLPQCPQNFLISVIFFNNIEFKVDIGEEKSVTYNSFGQILKIKDYNKL